MSEMKVPNLTAMGIYMIRLAFSWNRHQSAEVEQEQLYRQTLKRLTVGQK